MSKLQVRQLPVMNRQKRLVGIVAWGDPAAKQEGPAAASALKTDFMTSEAKMHIHFSTSSGTAEAEARNDLERPALPVAKHFFV
jgi:CBS-domain-containing membrane protein